MTNIVIIFGVHGTRPACFVVQGLGALIS